MTVESSGLAVGLLLALALTAAVVTALTSDASETVEFVECQDRAEDAARDAYVDALDGGATLSEARNASERAYDSADCWDRLDVEGSR